MEATETEQPSPPLRSPEVGELLSKIWDAAWVYSNFKLEHLTALQLRPSTTSIQQPRIWNFQNGSGRPILDFGRPQNFCMQAQCQWEGIQNFTFSHFGIFWQFLGKTKLVIENRHNHHRPIIQHNRALENLNIQHNRAPLIEFSNSETNFFLGRPVGFVSQPWINHETFSSDSELELWGSVSELKSDASWRKDFLLFLS